MVAYQAVKFDFTANLTGIGNRSEVVICSDVIFTILFDNTDTDIEMLDTCVRDFLLS